MLTLDRTNAFKRDFKREVKNPNNADAGDLLKTILDLLLAEAALPEAYCDHPLKGKWKGFRDCHLKPNLVLIYRKTETEIELVRIGSHSEIFG